MCLTESTLMASQFLLYISPHRVIFFTNILLSIRRTVVLLQEEYNIVIINNESMK